MMFPTDHPRDDDFPQGMVEEITRTLIANRNNKRGQDVYDEVFNTGTMFPLQRKTELAHMMQLAREIEPKVVYEIGSDKAGGLYHWCKSIPSVKRVIACEIRGTPYAKAFENAFPNIEFLWLNASSYDPVTVQTVERWLRSDKINCLFIDGDKLEFRRDFDCYLPLMSHPGRVFMHDIQDRSPRDAFLTLIPDYRWTEYINTDDTIEAIVRQRQGIPSSCAWEDWLRHWKGKSCGIGTIYLD